MVFSVFFLNLRKNRRKGAVHEVGYFLNSPCNFMFFHQKIMKLQHLFQCPKKLFNFSDTSITQWGKTLRKMQGGILGVRHQIYPMPYKSRPVAVNQILRNE
jgi:hypothetical protein